MSTTAIIDIQDNITAAVQEAIAEEIGLDNKGVEDWLKEVNYGDDPGYMPSDFALEFVNFIKLVNGVEGEENVTPVIHYKMLDNIQYNDKDTINMCHRGVAKALSLDTPIPTPTGWKTMAQLQLGDQLFSEDGSFTRVLVKSEIFNNQMYELKLADGRILKVNEDHINVVLHRRQKRIDGRRVNYLDRRNLPTKELAKTNLFSTRKANKKHPKGRENKVWLPLPKPVQYPVREYPVDPYTLGLLIGDGAMAKDTGFARLHSHVDDMPHLLKYLTNYSKIRSDKRNPNCVRVSLLGVGKHLKHLGLNCHGDDKFIPEAYLLGSIGQRLALVQGLMDTDGTVYKGGCCAFTSNSLTLIKGLQELIWSLGGSASYSPMNRAYRLNIRCNQPLFRLPRKAQRQHFKCDNKIPLIAVKPIVNEPSQCISVTHPSKTFLAGQYVVTHNTTVLGTYMILYCAVYGDIPGFGKVPYVLYVSDAVENGVKKMRKDLEFRWDNSKFLQEWLPYKRLTDVRWEFANKDKVHFVCTGHGAKTGVRGTRELGTRPLLAILDDLISDDDARSPTVIASVEDTVYKAVDYALHPARRKIIWSGTPFNARDPLYKAVESGAWHVNVYPICEKFPCSRKEFKGSWENRFSFDYVQKQYTKALLSHKIDTFNQELMLRIMSEEDRLITDDEILWYGRDLLIQNKDAYNFYITTDFATSEKQAADFSVIMVWAYNAKGQWFWVDGVCKKQTMDHTMNDLFRLAQKWDPQQVGIEISGQQQAFIPWIQDQMMIRKIWFNLAKDKDQTKPGIRPNTDKMKRFNIVVPWFKSGMIFFPREMQLMPIMGETIDELSLISLKGMKSRHDDTNDAISMLANLSPWKPSLQLPPEDEVNIWETNIKDDGISGMDSYTP